MKRCEPSRIVKRYLSFSKVSNQKEKSKCKNYIGLKEELHPKITHNLFGVKDNNDRNIKTSIYLTIILTIKIPF